MRTRIVIVAGPTASGKSALALAVAAEMGGTVINADSMQVYRDLPILTAQPGPADLAGVPHRLYGVLDGAELCSAARWAEMARAEIAATVGAGRLPVLCGGTGLYIKTLLHGIATLPPIPDEVRQGARMRHAERGAAEFHALLAALDPAAAGRLHPGDTQRVIRAYEVVVATGRPLADWQRDPAPDAGAFDALSFVILPPRAALYAAIDGRFDRMIAAGALEEVAALATRHLPADLPIQKALGVTELSAYLAGTLPLEVAIQGAQQASRRYAKRQYTWFRHQLPEAERLDAQDYNNFAGLICQKIRK